MNRDIFEYENGERKVFADPLFLNDQLMVASDGTLWDAWNKLVAIDSANGDMLVIMEGIKAREYLANLARRVFKLVPFNDATGEGMTPSQCIDVLVSFLVYLTQKKTRREPSLTTSPSTGSTPQPPTSPTMATTSASS